ncbi:MAG TPA: arginine--tRNA ligase [Candidatus Scatomorpha merdipullorum]|uniref:Arginine--tRNA ligase n=1 Tax=Candidatus Scatomorpha merdipullorum TaxID=2840927 RepID=A0A9D1FC46_9FIRM|nr:arginine--tRNA ligase [Candidatus Scatomorpha merdipullorum]
MSNLVQDAKAQINALLAAAQLKAAAEGLIPEAAPLSGVVEIPKDSANGDFAANHAMTGARALRMAPRKIADALVVNLSLEGSYFVSAEAAGPGFINFRLGPAWYGAVLAAVSGEGASYGRSEAYKGRRIMVEFVSANPTGPMHMGNARGGVLGDTLAEVLSRAGAEVSREFYVNDAGNQIEKFATSIDARYAQLILGEDAVEFPEDGYHGDDIRDLAAAFRAEYGDGYLEKPVAERHEVMARFGLANNLPKMKADLERYGISYDSWFMESSLHESGYVADTAAELTRLGYTYEKDGALWLATSRIIAEKLRAAGKSEKDIEKLDLKDDVLRRANGFYTYFAADIAYHRNKLAVRGFDTAINIWGADHHGHVARLKAALDALGLDGEHRLVIVLMQLVKLLRDGEVVRMSKRTGKAISLTDLLDEVPRDAARWFFNSRPDTQMDFDLGLAVREDSENPVYYVQYAHARICSVIRNLAEAGHAVPAPEEIEPAALESGHERELIKQLAGLPDELLHSAEALDPSRINRYAMELAARFHRFYNACRIKGEAEPVLKARLLLADCTRGALEVCLGILGVSAPEHM